jgi:tetratricopeptide (TPR) repeat protein
MVRLGWFAAAAVVLLQVHDGRADARSDALTREATSLYESGDYEGAAAALLKGYELQPDPRFLFNIARAYDKAGNSAEATRFYHRYLDAMNETEPALLQRAREALDRLEPKAPQPPAPVVAPVPTVPPPPAEPPVTPPPAPPPSMPPPAHASHAIPYAVGGAGIALVLAGFGVALWANATATEMHNSLDPVEKPVLRTDALTRATAADITMGVGAALVITGVVLRFTSHPASPSVRVGLAGSSCTLDFSWARP